MQSENEIQSIKQVMPKRNPNGFGFSEQEIHITIMILVFAAFWLGLFLGRFGLAAGC